MEISDKEAFANILLHIAECFPHGKMTDDRINAYFQHLKKFEITAIHRCIKRLVNDFDRMPSAGQMYRLVNSEAGGGAGGVPGWRETKAMLEATHGATYYAEDYAEGVRLGQNRPVREVLVDEISRGWRNPNDLWRHDKGGSDGN